MKKTILILILLPLFTFGQRESKDSLQINEKALGWFKSNYVEKSFKDPYSFKLMKISNSSISFKQWILNDLESAQRAISEYEQKKKLDKYEKELYDGTVKRRALYQEQLNTLTPEDSQKVKCYEILIDCYGANSYGNLILSKYKFNFFTDKLPPVSYVQKVN